METFVEEVVEEVLTTTRYFYKKVYEKQGILTIYISCNQVVI